MPSNKDSGSLSWIEVFMVSLIIVCFGLMGGKKLSDSSQIDLNLPACVPAADVVNKVGACSLDDFDVGTLVDFDGKVFAVTKKDYYEWRLDPYELRIQLTERKLGR